MINILFICTHNRCRSLLSEAILNHFNDKRIMAQSAGSHPAETVHPATIKNLKLRDIATSNLYSKSWDSLKNFVPDLVITVCDQAANEVCPVWLGEAQKIHWGLPDPSCITNTTESTKKFAQVMTIIEHRLNFILSHDIENMDRQQLKSIFLTAKEKT